MRSIGPAMGCTLEPGSRRGAGSGGGGDGGLPLFWSAQCAAARGEGLSEQGWRRCKCRYFLHLALHGSKAGRWAVGGLRGRVALVAARARAGTGARPYGGHGARGVAYEHGTHGTDETDGTRAGPSRVTRKPRASSQDPPRPLFSFYVSRITPAPRACPDPGTAWRRGRGEWHPRGLRKAGMDATPRLAWACGRGRTYGFKGRGMAQCSVRRWPRQREGEAPAEPMGWHGRLGGSLALPLRPWRVGIECRGRPPRLPRSRYGAQPTARAGTGARPYGGSGRVGMECRGRPPRLPIARRGKAPLARAAAVAREAGFLWQDVAEAPSLARAACGRCGCGRAVPAGNRCRKTG